MLKHSKSKRLSTPSTIFDLSHCRVLRKRTTLRLKPQKVVFLRFKRTSQKRTKVLLWISKKNSTFAVALCAHMHNQNQISEILKFLNLEIFES